MRVASASVIGIGLLSDPRKPVTLGVFLIRWYASSVISIFTSTYPGKNRRSLVTLRPRRVSTTSSVGTRTCSNSSPSPLAAACSLIESATLFSKFEQASPIYHLLVMPPAVRSSTRGGARRANEARRRPPERRRRTPPP